MNGELMTAAGFWFGLIFVAYLAMVVPLWRIMSRIGFPGFLALFCATPPLLYIALWAIAFMPWPGDSRTYR